MKKLLIVGGSDAGISAALRARELRPEVDVAVIVTDHYPNYSICGIPYYLSREVEAADDLAHRTATDIEDAGIQLLLGHRAERVDAASRLVVVQDEQGRRKTLEYDQLIIATGAASVLPGIRGLGLPGVFTLRWMDDTFAVERYLEQQRPASATIIGGGYIGMEMAEALTTRGLEVAVIEFAATVMTTLDPDLGQRVEQELAGHGVRVVNGVNVEAIAAAGGKLAVKGSGGFQHASDMVLLVVGARPMADLAASAGLDLGIRGAIKVNRRMETNVPAIYAAGDCVETWHRLLNAFSYMPLGTTAHKQGRIAGENALGGEREFAGTLGTQVVKIFNLVVARTGFHDADARNAGYVPLSVDTETWDHKVYYPGASRMLIRVTGDQTTGKLLGAQIIGRHGAEISKRIDVFATALFYRMQVEALNDLDLSYTPPLSSPWDPVQMSAQNWRKIANHPHGP
jgi:NADPH-dependent 2,4-dienoyl-CoA reductase/sulfur reductase-like enzyme